jgi:maleate isomerase
VLFTGTGMPSLRAIDTLAQSCDIPVLSTSLCMAWALAKRVQLELPPGPHPLLNGWQSRIGQL